ncbi:MAG: M48 family metalloprotease [Deltaproteobacteria bacterium]|nr:M48 family metalloprotease [Deltaproteobacteria bacterium]
MNELDQARALLPSWVAWGGPLTYLLLAAAVSFLSARLAIAVGMVGYRKVAEAHWTERARQALPARALSILCVLFLPALCAVHAHFWVGPFALGAERVLEVAAVVTSLGVTSLVHFRLVRQVLPEPPRLAYWLKGAVAMLLVMRPMLPIVVAMVVLAPDSLFTRSGAVWLIVGVLLLVLAAGGVTVPLGRQLGLVLPPSERLEKVVAAAARRAGHAPRAVYELVWPAANAAAYPMAGVLVFSDAALRLLDDDEVEAIAAHELGHLTEPRAIKALRMVQAALWLPIAALRSIVQDYGLTGLLVVLIGTMLLFVLLQRVSVRMERRADARAREQVEDAGSFARALEKIYRANAIPAVSWARGTHPHLYDRMVAAGHPPAFERPQRPSRLRLYVGTIAALCLALGILLAASWAPTFAQCGDTDDEWPCLVWLASGDGGAWELGTLAEMREARGQRSEAIILYRAAAVLAVEPSADLARLAVLLVLDQRCQEAAIVAEQLKQQVAHTPGAQEHLDYAAALLPACQSTGPADPGLVDPDGAMPDAELP